MAKQYFDYAEEGIPQDVYEANMQELDRQEQDIRRRMGLKDKIIEARKNASIWDIITTKNPMQKEDKNADTGSK